MNQFVLPPEQVSIPETSLGRIAAYGTDGSLVGYVSPAVGVQTPDEPLFTPEEIASAERQLAAGAPGMTTAEMLQMLRAHSANRS